MIVRDCTILLKNESASLSDMLVLYKGDQNIEYTFTLKDNAYRFEKSDPLGNVVNQLEASYSQILWYKDASIQITFPIQATNDGKVVLKIEKELIDESNEVGDYDLQIRLYDSNKEAILTLPPLLKAIHVKSPLFESVSAVADTALVDATTIEETGTEEVIFGEDGNYLKTTWTPGMKITSSKLNKIEEAIYKNTLDINDINPPLKYSEIDESTMTLEEYKEKIEYIKSYGITFSAYNSEIYFSPYDISSGVELEIPFITFTYNQNDNDTGMFMDSMITFKSNYTDGKLVISNSVEGFSFFDDSEFDNAFIQSFFSFGTDTYINCQGYIPSLANLYTNLYNMFAYKSHINFLTLQHYGVLSPDFNGEIKDYKENIIIDLSTFISSATTNTILLYPTNYTLEPISSHNSSTYDLVAEPASRIVTTTLKVCTDSSSLPAELAEIPIENIIVDNNNKPIIICGYVYVNGTYVADSTMYHCYIGKILNEYYGAIPLLEIFKQDFMDASLLAQNASDGKVLSVNSEGKAIWQTIPKLEFSTDGDLVVTINGITKTFTPKLS